MLGNGEGACQAEMEPAHSLAWLLPGRLPRLAHQLCRLQCRGEGTQMKVGGRRALEKEKLHELPFSDLMGMHLTVKLPPPPPSPPPFLPPSPLLPPPTTLCSRS